MTLACSKLIETAIPYITSAHFMTILALKGLHGPEPASGPWLGHGFKNMVLPLAVVHKDISLPKGFSVASS